MNHSPANIPSRVAVAGLLFGFFVLQPAFATSTSWTGLGATPKWSDVNNWGGSTPAYGTLLFNTGGTQGTSSTNDSITSMNILQWTGSLAWTINQGGSTVLSLYDNSGAQPKIEQQSSGLVTLNAPITFAQNNASPPNPFGEINAVSGNILFGSAATLTVNGTSCNGIKLWNTAGDNVTFSNTVSASGKWFGMTQNPSGSTTIGGAFTSGDFYVMNGGTLNLTTNGSFTTTAVRLGGDYGNTGNQIQTLGGTFALTSAYGGQTFSSLIDSVSGNTSGALAVYSANTSGTNIIASGIYLDSGLLITNAAGGTLALTGNADLKAQQLILGPSGTIFIGAPLTNSLAAGATILVNGPGTVLLTNQNNQYTGTSTSSLNANGTQIANGATLGIYGDGCLGLAPAGAYNNIQFTGSGTLQDTINNVTLAATRSLSIASGATATLDSSTNTFTIGGIVNGSGSLVKVSSGSLTLNGVNTYSGATTISGGTLTIGGAGDLGSGSYSGLITNNGTFTYNSSVAQTLSGVISGTGALKQSGSGTLTLSGANTFSGATTLSGGTLQLQNASALASSALTMSSGTTLSLEANGATTFAPVSVNEASAGGAVNYNFYVANNGSGTANTLILANLGQFGPAGSTDTFNVTGANNYTLQLGSGSAGTGALSFYNSTTLNANTAGVTLSIPGGLTVNYASSYSLALGGAGNITLGPLTRNGSSNLTPTFGGSGTITLNGANNFGAAAGTISTIGTLALNAAAALTGLSSLAVNNPVTLDNTSGGAITISATPAQTWSTNISFGTANTTGALNLGTGTVALNVPNVTNTIVNSSYGLTVGGVISGAYGLSKAGPGTLTLTGVNTYSGGTTNAAGTLTIGGAGQLGSGTYAGAILNNAAFNYNSSANQTFSGVISGAGSLTEAGAGTLTLSGVNTYSGTTTISGGNLVAMVGGSASSSAVSVTPASGYADLTISNAATGGQWTCSSLTFNSGGSGDVLQFGFGATPSTTTAPLNITGNLTVNVTPTVVINPANLVAGTYPLLVVGGTAPSTVPTLSLSAFASSSLAWGGTGNKTLYLTVAGSAVTDPLTWAASGSGTWDIDDTGNAIWKDSSATPQSTYYDQIPGSSGDSVVFGDKYISASPTVTLNSTVSPASVVASDSIYNYTIAGTGGIAGSGGLTKKGSATLTLSTANTYTGGTVVTNGTLTLDFTPGTAPAANIVPSGSALTLGGGTFNIKGSASSASSQTVGGVTLRAGNSVISAAPVSGANYPTLTLGALPANAGPGATIEFIGPATTNSAGNVPATAIITTTTAGTGSGGNMGYFGNGDNGGYATVGLYDWATTDTSAGGAGTSPYTIIGGSQVAGFYQQTGVTTGGNYDVITSGVNSLGNSGGAATVRFNQPSALTITFSASTAQNIQGFLVTPNCGANNETLAGGSGNGIEFGRYTSAGNVYGVLWQNNTSGYFNINCALEGGRQAGQANGLVQAGPGTVAYLQPNNYELSTYLNGGYSVVIGDSGFGNLADASTVYLNGGTVVGNATFTMDNSGANARPFVLGSTGGGLAATAGSKMTVDGYISSAAGTGPLTIGIPASSANGSVAGLLPGSGTGTANTTPVYATGTVVLNGAGNGYSGGTIITAGATLNINSVWQLGGAVYGGLTFNGGTLQYNTTPLNTALDITANTVNGSGLTGGVAQNVTLAGNATIDVNGNTVTYTNALGNSGSGSLTVYSANGTGSLTLLAASTYTGTTTITNATLVAANSSGSATGTNTVNVNNNGTLAGNGTISGNVTVNSGGIIAPATTAAGNGTVGSLTIGSLTMGAGSIYNLAFSTTPANDKIVVSTSAGLVINGGAFNLYQPGGTTPFTTPGTYNLIQYTGSIGGTGLDSTWTTAGPGNVHVANRQAGFTYQFGASGGYVTLTIVGLDVGVWGVNSDGNWSTAANWTAVTGTMPPQNPGDGADTRRGHRLAHRHAGSKRNGWRDHLYQRQLLRGGEQRQHADPGQSGRWRWLDRIRRHGERHSNRDCPERQSHRHGEQRPVAGHLRRGDQQARRQQEPDRERRGHAGIVRQQCLRAFSRRHDRHHVEWWRHLECGQQQRARRRGCDQCQQRHPPSRSGGQPGQQPRHRLECDDDGGQ